MKTNKFLINIFAIIIAISFNSCVDDADFTVPEALGTEENKALNTLMDDLNSGAKSEISIANLKGLFVAGQVTEITSDIVVKGYVSSSDRSGNFFKEFFIQDSPSNPTAAIKVGTEFVDSYNKFNFGREIYINLKGLFIGEVRSGDDVITIGGARNTDDEVENLSLTQTSAHVLRASNTEQMVPLTATFGQLNDSKVGLYVEIKNVQFPASLAGKTYVEATDQFDTKRTLQACNGFGFASFNLETSAFADFKFRTLPAGGGSINAVVSKTFNGSEVVLVLNNVNDVKIDATGNRCTPLDINDFTALVSQDFENMPSTNPLGGNGWVSFAEAGRFNWRVLTTNDSGNAGSKIASMGAFRSGDASNIAWLISPAINLDAQGLEFLNFKSSNSFSDNSELKVLISTNWDGNTANINTATWVELDATVVSDGEFFQNWVDSGTTDLSSFTGNAHIAFKYIGGDNPNNEDGTYEIDNFQILVRR